MSKVMQARVVLALIGVVVWGYGTAVDDPNIRIAGIALLAVSLVLRFADRRPQKDDSAM
ncbi:MAG TPA: hypothetical protein VEB19_09275 [Gemmatimonadaceae bacterium]|nr:hypothetical protein [Gemmatimonadaceae bacterium]